jgi:predicted dehydrogenase
MASSRRDFLKQSGLGIAGGSLLALAPELGAAPLRLSRALKVGLAGVGRQGRVVLGELAKFDDVQLVAICDTDPSRLRAGKRRARGAEAYASVSEMLDKQKGLDAVIVATPTHTHREVAEQCLAAKLHVYCESPLASTEEDARALAQASRGASRILQCGMQGRSNPVYSLARSFFRAGAIGKTLGLRAQWHKKTSWRTPAPSPELEKARNWRLDPKLTMGLLGEMGAQQFDVFHWMLDAYPTEVYARGAVLAWEDGREVEDTVSCELHFDEGVSLHYDACLANSYEGANELLYGTNATIKLAWTTAGCSRKPTPQPRAGRSTPTASSSTTTRASRSSPAPPSSPSRASSRTASACRTHRSTTRSPPTYREQARGLHGRRRHARKPDLTGGAAFAPQRQARRDLHRRAQGSPRRPATWSTITRTGMGAKGSATTTSRASTAVCAALHRCASHSRPITPRRSKAQKRSKPRRRRSCWSGWIRASSRSNTTTSTSA